MKSRPSGFIVTVLNCNESATRKRGDSENLDHQVPLLSTIAMRSNLHPSVTGKYQHENTSCSVIKLWNAEDVAVERLPE